MLETQIVCKNKRQICYQEGAKLRGIVPAPHKYFLEYMAMHPTPAQITFNLAFEAQANNVSSKISYEVHIGYMKKYNLLFSNDF